MEEFDNYIVPNTIFVSLASAPPVDELKMLSGVEDAVSVGGMDYRVNFRIPGGDYPDRGGKCDPELAIVGDTYGEEFHG